MKTEIHIRGFAGGLGATVLALTAARQMNEPTLVIASKNDVYAHAGLMQGIHTCDDAPHLTVVSVNDYASVVDDTSAFRYIFWDTPTPIAVSDIQIGIVRNDYASLWNATRNDNPSNPVTHWLIREEPERALSARDCVATLGATNFHVTETDPALARLSDAGLLIRRKATNDAINWVVQLINQREVAHA